jgi:GNAT superfamily N-acetyltransferase
MILLREPKESDAQDLSELLAQLGYPANVADIPARLAALRSDPDAVVFVAESDGHVVGVVTAHVLRSLHRSELVAMLTLLVVAEAARRRGIGEQLVRHAEAWASARGTTAISLTSALRRTDAHAFYQALGYDHTGVRLAKTLTPTPRR